MFNNQIPYQNFYPYQANGANTFGLGARKGLLGGLKLHNINWSNVLNNTQKTLNVINQAIPVYYQMKPIYNNARTMLRMVTALKDNDNQSNNTNNNYNYNQDNKKNTNQDGPVFFL